MQRRIIYWFRSDLRLHDNEGLARAVEDADAVLPVFVFDPVSFAPLPDIGVPKAGGFRARFLLESLADLRARLRQKGGELLIRTGNPADVLAQLARDHNVVAVYASQDVTSEELAADNALRSALKPLGVPLVQCWTMSLYHPDDAPFGINEVPDVFRDFRRALEHESGVRDEVPEPDRVPVPAGVDEGKLPTLAELGFGNVVQDERAAIRHVGGETAALARLDAYVWERDQLKNYKFTRNGLLGEDYSSKFSAGLAYGCLSPRRIWHEVRRYEAERKRNVSTYWLVFELIWRDYFRFQAAKWGRRIFLPKGPRNVVPHTYARTGEEPRPLQKNGALFEKWAAGQTGVPFVDANMRELNATGYMSNRGRQNVASLLINDLGVLWTWGAAYLESLLIDYDPCSNWGNWNMVARVGADPRNDRYFNIYTQATRYDPNGHYVKRWCPELAHVPPEHLHLLPLTPPDALAAWNVVLGETYPEPLIDVTKWKRGRPPKRQPGANGRVTRRSRPAT